MMLNKIFNKTYIFLFIFLVACSSSANQDTQHNKIFELDLTDEQISTEGGEIELKKGRNNCSLILNLYSRSLAKVNSRASNSPFQQLNSFLDQIVSVYFYSVLSISENV